MSSKEVARIIVETPEVAGIRHCYGIVGNTLNHITNAIHRSQIQWIHVRHEEAAAFATGVESYVSERLTACADSCGPNNLYFINGVYKAQRNRAPTVLIVSQIVTPQLDMEFPQEIGLKTIYASCSVFREQVHSPEQTRRVVTLAYQAAFNQRGVAVVILPTDISQATVKDNLPPSVHFPQPVLCPSGAELQGITRLSAHGKKIGIYAGFGHQGAHDLLVILADCLEAPITHTPRTKDSAEYDNPFNVGMAGTPRIESGFRMMTKCDTLLLLGTDFAWAWFYPQEATLIQIDHNGSHLSRHHPVDLGVVGGVIPTLEALLPLLEVRGERNFLDECLKHREHSLRTLGEEERAGKDELTHPQHLVNLLDQHTSEDALFTADSGLAMVWLLCHIHSNGKHRILTSLVHGTMVNAMPQALGLKKAYPERQVISIPDNGGLAMPLGDLLTATQEKLPIKAAALNDTPLSLVELEQKVENLLDNYADLLNPSFARLAEVIGFHGRKVTRSEDLEVAVREFLAQPGPALLDVHIDPTELVISSKIELGQVADIALCAAKTVLSGRFKDVETLPVNNLLKWIGNGMARPSRGHAGQARIPGRSVMSARPRGCRARRWLAVQCHTSSATAASQEAIRGHSQGQSPLGEYRLF